MAVVFQPHAGRKIPRAQVPLDVSRGDAEILRNSARRVDERARAGLDVEANERQPCLRKLWIEPAVDLVELGLEQRARLLGRVGGEHFVRRAVGRTL